MNKGMQRDCCGVTLRNVQDVQAHFAKRHHEIKTNAQAYEFLTASKEKDPPQPVPALLNGRDGRSVSGGLPSLGKHSK